MTKRKKKSIFKSWYYRIYFVLILLCVIGILIGMRVLNGVMEEYEATRPVHAAEEVADIFERRDFASIFPYDTTAAQYAAGQSAQYVDFMNGFAQGKTLTWREAYSGEENEKKYSVLLDDEKFATFKLVTTGETSAHGYNTWKLDSVETNALPVTRYTITAPADSTVTVDGRTLTEADALETGIKTACAGMLPPDVPEATCTQYFADVCFGEPAISVTDRFGAAQELTQDDAHAFSCAIPENESLKPLCEQNVIAIAQKLANFTSEDLSQNKMLKYVHKNSPAYNTIKEFDNQWCPAHVGYEFQDVQTSDYFDYGDACFSCRVSFKYVIHYAKTDDNVYDTAYTLYFYKKDGSFKLYNFTMG